MMPADAMTSATRIAGRSVPRMDAPGKVTGTALYAADFALPGMLYGKVLRSSEPHARLVRINAGRAARLPGVRAVITAADVPDVRYGGSVKDERVFARDRIRFAGQPLAAVAATSPDAAAAALTAIEVVCEPLRPVFDVAAALAPSKVRVIVPGIGGGFGGKLRIGVEHFAALLAMKTGRPVKVMTTSEEELTAAYARQPATVAVKTGVTNDGRLTAREARLWFDTGAFAGSGPGVASVATLMLAGPYRIPNLLLEGFAVYTNKTNFGSFRAPSGPQANFAVESQMDIIADALGLDPLELRLKNIVREGEEGPTGQVLTAVGLEECLHR